MENSNKNININNDANANEANIPANEKRVKKIISGNVVTKPKNKISKFFSKFIAEDGRSVKDAIQEEIIIPSIKDLIVSAIQRGAEVLIYGKDRPHRNIFGNVIQNIPSQITRIGYENCFNTKSNKNKVVNTNSSYAEYNDIILESRGDAQLVLDQMDDLIETYGVASLADLYEAVGAPYEYTAHNFGWTNIHSAKIQHVYNGWLIKMPKAYPIN